MDKVLQNFSVGDCICNDGPPKNGTIFELWINGSEHRIDADFARLAWSAMGDATDCFRVGGKYTLAQGETAEETLYNCLLQTQTLIKKVSEEISPFEFDAYILDFEDPEFCQGQTLGFDSLQLMSAFMIICIDKAISSLLENNAPASAKFAMFIGTSLFIMNCIKEPEQINFSENGKEGANKRHAPMRELRRWAVALYQTRNWVSANQAAHDLKDQVMGHGRTIDAILSPSNAQRTIASWFSKSV